MNIKDQQLPVDFIWPINANRHEENVRTIRQLIQDNPIEQLPFFNANQKTNRSLNVSNQNENQENVKIESNLIENNDAVKRSNQKMIQIKLINSTKKRKSNKRKKNLSIRPAHCPFCLKLFSATFNAKLHYNGRRTNISLNHISCKKAPKNKDKIIEQPIPCTKNCEICANFERNSEN